MVCRLFAFLPVLFFFPVAWTAFQSVNFDCKLQPPIFFKRDLDGPFLVRVRQSLGPQCRSASDLFWLIPMSYCRGEISSLDYMAATSAHVTSTRCLGIGYNQHVTYYENISLSGIFRSSACDQQPTCSSQQTASTKHLLLCQVVTAQVSSIFGSGQDLIPRTTNLLCPWFKRCTQWQTSKVMSQTSFSAVNRGCRILSACVVPSVLRIQPALHRWLRCSAYLCTTCSGDLIWWCFHHWVF